MEIAGKPALQVLNVLGFLGTVIVNILANALPLNGKTTAELSDAYPNLFVPAGYVFAIWGVIYILLAVFCIYQFSSTHRDKAFHSKIGYWFVLASIANMSWIFFWHYELLPFSLGAMSLLLVSLLTIYIRVDIGRVQVDRKEKWSVHVPFSVYLGWITVATVANIVALLVAVNWDGLGIPASLWTQLILVVVLLLTILMLVTRKDFAYSAVIVWAVAGIYVKQLTLTPEVALFAGVIALAVVLGILGTGVYEYYYKPRKKTTA